MEDVRHRRHRCFASAAIGGVCLVTARRKSAMSLRAWLVLQMAARFAPDLGKADALAKAIADSRAKGPATPPKRVLKRLRFSDELLGTDRIFRLRPPQSNGDNLKLLYLHGGAYVLEVQSVQWNVVAGLQQRLGGEVIAPIYPLAPEFYWRFGLEAVLRTYRALATEYGAHNVVIVGDSAGGGLALTLAHTLRDTGADQPAALLLFSPWLDIGVVGPDQPQLEKRDPALTISFLRSAGKLWAAGLALSDPRVSPLFGDHTDLPPTIVFSGDRDILHSDALRFAQRSRGVDHRSYPEMIHVWPVAPTPEAKHALDEAALFARHHLEGSCLFRNSSANY